MPQKSKSFWNGKQSSRAWASPSYVGLVLIVSVLMAGCIPASPKEVVVYAALDKEFSQPILQEFGKQSGIRVLDKYDVESNKTVGLANELIASSERPRADLFWNNEILHTLRLEKLGLLEAYTSPLAENYPAQFVSPSGYWHGFAARARVLIVNKSLLPDPATWPTSILDLAKPEWKGNCGLAKPLFGTTASHAAVLFSIWPKDQAESFFRQLHQNAQIEGGNKRVAQNVASGRYAFGLTDTDDAVIELEAGQPVAIVFPDQGPDQFGTLLIPNTLGVIKNGPNSEHAKELVDYLLSAEVEQKLATGLSAQIPIGKLAGIKSRVAPQGLKVQNVDFSRAAEQWESAQEFLVDLFR